MAMILPRLIFFTGGALREKSSPRTQVIRHPENNVPGCLKFLKKDPFR
jgi:hypothetical protein